jgi:NFU1 iron-sulfur cluster scaffold homolog, mitochondrial
MPKIRDIEPTPNPNAMKFILKEPLTAGGSRSYDRATDAEGDQLASALFAIDHVTSVFYMDRFLTVTKDPFGNWDDLMPRLAVPIREAPSAADQPEPEKQSFGVAPPTGEVDNQDLLDRINEVLDERIRPGLAGDGGGLQVLGLVDNTLTVRYQGACGTCPSAIAGTLMAIENMLRMDVDPELNVISV